MTPRPARSPFGPDDEIGMLNLVDGASMQSILAEVDAHRVFDLAVDYFVGMPSWAPWGDPPFQAWMTATPHGSAIDDTTGHGRESNELVSRSADAISMFTHCGTHIDALNHFGYHGSIWNCFTNQEHLGARGWRVAGADKLPPVIARGVLVDVAGAHGVDVLPDNYAIGESELRSVLGSQRTDLRRGDIVLVRTGRMSRWPDPQAFANDEPGIDLGGARYLADAGAVVVGADNLALEAYPTGEVENWSPVHTFLLAEAGVPIMEVVNTQALAEDGVHEFAFIGACLRIRGATGSPIRPLALPLRK